MRSRRALAIFAAVTTSLGALILTFAIPTTADITTAAGYGVGLLVGLMFTPVGGSPPAATPRRKGSFDMIHMPTPHGVPSVQAVLTGHGYLSTHPHRRDDLSMILTYDARQPYSVLVDIAEELTGGLRPPDSVVWEVSREILHDAVILGRPSGFGDFSAVALGASRVRLRLVGTDEWGRDAHHHYDLHVGRDGLREWLLRTMALVPMGEESDHLDIDRQLERLLA